MCYSALVKQGLSELERRFHARVDRASFRELFQRRNAGEELKISKALEDNFLACGEMPDADIAADIVAHREAQAAKWQREIFKQKARLADAQRTAKVKETRKSREDERIASSKIEILMQRLADLNRREANPDDERIFPMYYAPVIVGAGNDRFIRPMRYTCRLSGKPADYDRRFPGTYNARRDNLTGFWSGVFGSHHAVMVVTSFYENVAKEVFERGAKLAGEKSANVVLQFKPQPAADMIVACVWSHWRGSGAAALDSFAAITDEPPAEIAATGHNRCIIALSANNVDAWLDPVGVAPDQLQRLLDERPTLVYEHRIAA